MISSLIYKLLNVETLKELIYIDVKYNKYKTYRVLLERYRDLVKVKRLTRKELGYTL